MAFFDMPLAQLREYLPPLTRHDDFAAFWQQTLAAATALPLDSEFQPAAYPVAADRIYDVTYTGWSNARIAGRYIHPDGAGPFPALVIYHGYSGHKPSVFDLLAWTVAGFAVLAIDVRGQSGDSTDSVAYPGGHSGGWMTQGIHDRDSYYYRGVYVDCVRAIDVLASRPEVDADRIGVHGGSQGGGLSLATAALDRRVRVALAEIPFLCHYDRAITLVDTHPYAEIGTYCRRHPAAVDQVLRTLSYFDVMNLADQIACPTHVSVGLMDQVCPPSTIFAAYNRIAAPKDIFVSQFGVHEHFEGVREAQLSWALQHLT